MTALLDRRPGLAREAPPGGSIYGRLLRLRHIRPNAWQRALFIEGSLVAGIVLVLADLASAWLIPVLPVAVAAVVKFHDLLAGALARNAEETTGGPNRRAG